jgi:formylglycine-generating enzyme required for sulfatase activity
MTEQRPLKVFLCHASADKPAVRKLYRRLLAEEWIDSWLDKEKLSLEQHWTTIIEDALDAADIVLIFLSRNSVHREGFVQRELNYAWDLSLKKPIETIFLIPFRLDDCEVPRHLRSRHWGDYFGDKEENTYQTLLRSLKQRHEQKLQLEAEEQKERDALEKSTNGNAEQSAVKKSAREKEERDTVQKVKQEKSNSDGIKKDARTFNSKKTRMVGIMLVALVLGVLGINFAVNNWPATILSTLTSYPPTKTATFTPKPTIATLTSVFPSATLTLKPPASTSTSTSTSSPIPGLGSTKTATEDGMKLVFVPKGGFAMGSEIDDERPIWMINLDSFWIDQTEVTNKMYSLCVQAAICQPPSSTRSPEHQNYFSNSDFKNFPVIYVDWYKAKTYCEWAGRRLPTEAEWEKAARGANAYTYPWGNENPNSNLLNFNNLLGTTAVEKYPAGVSIYGAFDMAGNVWEWVSSLYKPYPYSKDDGREDVNASKARVIRGGSWYNGVLDVRSANRGKEDPRSTTNRIGFRCVLSAE